MDDNPAIRVPGGRRQDFPVGAKDLLKQVEKSARTIKTAGSRYVRDLQSNVDEHLFCLVDVKGTFTKRLSSWQELQLYDMLIDFFAGADKNAAPFFDLIFLGREGERERGLHEARLDVLIKVICLSVQVHCPPILINAGQWIQRHLQTKPPTPQMLQVAHEIVDDYCSEDDLPLNLHLNLLDIPKEAPTLAVVLLPLCMERFDLGVHPPSPFVEVAADWLSTNNKIFLKHFRETVKTGQQPTPWAKSFCTCFAKLACLTVLTPSKLYAKLHLALLQTMLTCSKMNIDTCKLLTTRNVNFCLQKVDEQTETRPELSLDFLTQLVQVAVSTKCFHGTRKELDPDVASRFVDNEILIFVLSNQLSL